MKTLKDLQTGDKFRFYGKKATYTVKSVDDVIVSALPHGSLLAKGFIRNHAQIILINHENSNIQHSIRIQPNVQL